MAIYTAWGKDGKANTFIGGEGPPTIGNCPGTPLDKECPNLIWTIEAGSWEEACTKYHELQGWEPYKPMENPRQISIARDFSETPGGRVRSDGEHSGQEFLERILRPQFVQARVDAVQLVVNLDGTYGYSTGFLEEAFGGLARAEGKDLVEIRLQFISTEEPYLVDEIQDYIRQA